MRRISHGLALASIVTLLMAGVATAAPPNTGCPNGPPVQQGGPATVIAWRLMDAALLQELSGASEEAIADEFATHDRNDDGLLCVLTEVLPNDASGAFEWFTPVDNVARGR